MKKLQRFNEYFEYKNTDQITEGKIKVSLFDKNIDDSDDKYKFHYVILNADNKDILKFVTADDKPNYASIEINNKEKIFFKKNELKDLVNLLQKLVN